MCARSVTTEAIGKAFGNERILEDISLHIEEGEFCVIVGPSGCGKSTFLNCLSGLVEVDDGYVAYDGADVTGKPVEDRDIGYVFQEFEDTLFPHRTVGENVAFGLEQQDGGLTDAAIDERVEEVLELLNIGETKDSVPEELSGGQQQRVELARQLVRRCDLFLFDDPLADLDYKLQKQMELEMRQIHEELGSTFVYVTHNQDQALKLADRLVVMNDGRIEQEGTPTAVYDSPATAFVARFVGDSNALTGAVVRAEDDEVVVDSEVGEVHATPRDDVGEQAGVVLLRPEQMAIGDAASGRDTTIQAELRGVTYTGEVTEFSVTADGLDREFIVSEPGRPSFGFPGDDVAVGWDAADAQYFERLSVSDSMTVKDIIRF